MLRWWRYHHRHVMVNCFSVVLLLTELDASISSARNKHESVTTRETSADFHFEAIIEIFNSYISYKIPNCCLKSVCVCVCMQRAMCIYSKCALHRNIDEPHRSLSLRTFICPLFVCWLLFFFVIFKMLLAYLTTRTPADPAERITRTMQNRRMAWASNRIGSPLILRICAFEEGDICIYRMVRARRCTVLYGALQFCDATQDLEQIENSIRALMVQEFMEN